MRIDPVGVITDDLKRSQSNLHSEWIGP
jgi:hypothetical protein